MKSIDVSIKRLAHSEGIPLPFYASEDAAAMDLCASDSLELAPMERKLIPTGFCIALPRGFEAQIRPRSGLAFKHGITVLNSPGTIDSDYRGEIKVLLINLGEDSFSITKGDRIAQMLISPTVSATLHEVEGDLPSTQRGAGGFGSTGVKS